MDDQKLLKKRLKALMNRPENQVCADCPERQPRWASLIVVPPGAPAGAQPIGAFVCLECSGSHRRLGVHIAFVRSINLDSWKEKEVLAMENGGNARVNAVFEPNLSNPNIKPHNHADGPTRERFIRDKYERRKYYDPNGFLTALSSAPALPRTQSSMSSGGGSEHEQSLRRESFGPPSDAARQRLEERRQRIKNNAPGTLDRTSSGIGNASNRKKTTIAKAPVSAPPPSVDLLDFGAATESNTTTQQNVETDFFGSDNTFTANFDTGVPAPAPTPTPAQPTSGPSNGGGGLDMFEFLTKDLKTTTPTTENRLHQSTTSFGGDIMSLYGPNNAQQAWGNASVPQLSTAMAGMGLGSNNVGIQQQQAYGMNGGQNQQQMMMMMQQQQQQQRNQMMYSMNNNNMMNSGNAMMMQGSGNPMGMQSNMMAQNSGMNNMMMQGNPMQQQNAYNMPGYGGGGGVNNGGGFNNNNFNGGGFGAPMGAGPPISSFSNGHDMNSGNKSKKAATPEKEDPFAQFGINVFRT